MSSELGWARCTTMERFMMLKLQLQQPAAVVILSNIKTNTPKQCSTKKMASELTTSSSSIAAVGETAARLAIEPRSPHGRHGERERRGQPLPASVFAPCWEVFFRAPLVVAGPEREPCEGVCEPAARRPNATTAHRQRRTGFVTRHRHRLPLVA